MDYSLFDRTSKYTVKEVSEMTGLTKHALRFYDDKGLLPYVQRNDSNRRLFSDYDLKWLHIVHCLRTCGLPVTDVKHYVDMCLQGPETIDERATLIDQLEIDTKAKIAEMRKQLKIVQEKKSYYTELKAKRQSDCCNPAL